MTRDFPDDDFGRSEFDRRLRDVLRSRALSISPDADALDRIHAGARRRQRRHRAAVSGGAALAVIAVAAVGVTLRPAHHSGSQVAGAPSSNVESTARATLNSPAPLTTLASPIASDAAPSQTVHQSIGGPAAIPAGGAPPNGFVPLSVTAVNANTYWVLGHAPCDAGTCTAIAKTSDGGKTFTEVAAPTSPVGPDAPGAKDVASSDVVSEIRFGDGKNGWAFGGGLWQTTDGGLTWSQVVAVDPSAPQFAVQRLAAANNRAWAVVLTNADAASGPVYAVYSTTYPGGTWARVDSAGTFGSAEPMLAVEGPTAVVIGTDAKTGAQKALIAKGGSTFSALPGSDLPCTYAPGDPLSTTTNALWMACASSGGKLSGAYVSPDFGSTWTPASSKLADARVAIGAVDAKSAITAEGGRLIRVSSDGSVVPVNQPKVSASTTFAFIGFTTADDGFAIPVVDGTRQLWRTTDGGSHWSVVKF